MEYKFSNIWESFVRFYNTRTVKSKVLQQMYICHINGDVKGFIRIIYMKFTYMIHQLDYDKDYVNSVLGLGKTDKKAFLAAISRTIKEQARQE